MRKNNFCTEEQFLRAKELFQKLHHHRSIDGEPSDFNGLLGPTTLEVRGQDSILITVENFDLTPQEVSKIEELLREGESLRINNDGLEIHIWRQKNED